MQEPNSSSASFSLKSASSFHSSKRSGGGGIRNGSEMKTIERTSRTSKIAESRLAQLTINKLKLQSIGLVGREKETDILRSRLKPLILQAETSDIGDVNVEASSTSLQLSEGKKELVLIKGFSGVGKTSLARTLKRDVIESKNGFFVEGKFDQNEAKDQPYSGIASAYSELIRQLSRVDRDTLLRIGQKLCEVLGTGVEPLTYLIPELEDFVTEYSTAEYSEDAMDGIQERWKYSFRILTRILTAYARPLVIAIDDLQWADEASLDLIDSLITDVQNLNPLMIIGCYRSNEVDENSDLSRAVASLTDKTWDFCFDITEIMVKSCGHDEVNQMIMKMMDTDDEESTKSLADICFRRTLGNPFFVIEFMSMLQREDLITFNIGTMKWVYDTSEIDVATVSTANVVELLQSRMHKMPEDVQLLMYIAACLGPTFRVSILDMLWRNLSYVESQGFELAKVPTMIDFMESEVLIEEWGVDERRWVHDKVQEAALSLVEVNKAALKFEMGKIMYLNLSEKGLEEELFDVVDLISSSNESRSSADFASLCLKAAKKAMRISAFSSSTRYIKNGIGMLPEDNWKKYQTLTLELYKLGAEIELAIGRVDESSKYCSDILNRDDIGFDDKVPFRVVEIKRMLNVEMRYADAIDKSLVLLEDLGFKFSWSRSLIPVQAVSLLSNTLKAVKQQPKDFHLHLEKMDDKYDTIAEILMRVSYASRHTMQKMQMILSMCHLCQLTMKHGLCGFSAYAFGVVGALGVIVFQKHEDIPRFRELAVSTQSQLGRTRVSLMLYSTYSYSLGWTLALESIQEAYFEGYVQGMQNGETEFSMWNLLGHFVSVPYSRGKPIDQILDECPKIVMQMEELSQPNQIRLAKLLWQMLLNLRHPKQGEDPYQLKGDIHTIESCGGHPLFLGWHNYAEFQLLLFYDDESAAERAIKVASDLSKASPGYFGLMIDAFHRAICLYRAARRTKKRTYKRHAMKIRKTIHKWKSVGNPNVVYYCIFLDAEQAALEGKYDEAETNYKQAIQFAARSGYLHHAALFNEVYSDFLLRERKDESEANYRLNEAIRFYEDWGALGKVEILRQSSHLEYVSMFHA